MSYERLGGLGALGATGGTTLNVVDRFLKEPRAKDADLAAGRRAVAAFFAPLTGFIDAVPLIPRSVKNQIKSDPFKLIFDNMQNGRDFIRELVNRVAERSKKKTRVVGGKVMRMTAQQGDSVFRLMGQFIVLMFTEYYALHEEAARMLVGLKTGTRGFLGEVATAAAVAVANPVTAVPVAVAAEVVTLTEIAAAGTAIAGALGGAAAILQALGPVINPLLSLATKDEASAETLAAAAALKAKADEIKARKGSGGSPVTGGGGVPAGLPPKVSTGAGAVAAGVVGVLGVGAFLWFKRRKKR